MCEPEAMEKLPCVYLLASGRNGTLHVGVTSDMITRVAQHREGMIDGFTKRYGVHDLVWYEVHGTMETAILREKQLKKWDRRAKLRLIEQQNPEWRDLWFDLASPSNRKRCLQSQTAIRGALGCPFQECRSYPSMDTGPRHKSAGSGFALTRRAPGRIARRESLPG
ncbi:GIY-YIG nuclease family protein [Methylocaldum gracile]|jgi:putative endonuclease|uniref:GIY-YIG nuclease family protein n=1 Tax=unclassified Methylocaldum TaxID=2622260 RepID=UPI003DA146AE